jgi:hypothetical protein
MTIDEIVRDVHALEADLENYERKYGILSETFNEAYSMGDESSDDAWVLDWSDCAGAYEISLRRHQQYQDLIRNLIEQTTRSEVMKRAACRAPLNSLVEYEEFIYTLPLGAASERPLTAGAHPHHKHIPPGIKHNRLLRN